MARESTITRAILAYLKARPNSHTLKLHGSACQQAGEPDILFLEAGCMFAFEVKTPAGRVSPLQQHRLEQWQAAGATAAVVRSVEQVKKLLD